MGSTLDARSNLERSWLKSCKMSRKCVQIVDRRRLWEHIGYLKGQLGRPWAQFARCFGGCGLYFWRFARKNLIFEFRCLTAVELQLLAVWATKLELLGYRSQARAAQSRLGLASGRGQDNQVSPVGAVWLSELWNPLGNCRNSAQT